MKKELGTDLVAIDRDSVRARRRLWALLENCILFCKGPFGWDDFDGEITGSVGDVLDLNATAADLVGGVSALWWPAGTRTCSSSSVRTAHYSRIPRHR
jgi:hypothetical protein